ncbi:MAG: ComF family protein [Chakrabartia sp.]
MARDLVLRLKYGRQPGLARVMARLMTRLAQLYPEAMLVPVPLHRWRLWSRGFNQSLLIARAVAARTGQEVLPDVLRRHRRTRPLGPLGRAARALEVRRAFAVDPQRAPQFRARDLFLVDDVFTSGATADACVAALKSAGAGKVRVLVWARVLDEAARR